MSRFLMDTDILSLFQQGHAAVIQGVQQVPAQDISLSTITLLEQMQGWQLSLTKARDHQQLALAHRRLAMTLCPTWLQFSIVPMTESSLSQFDQLRSLRLNVRAMDLRIAAIALSNQLTVVTRNLRDFQRVPSLSCEDWSV